MEGAGGQYGDQGTAMGDSCGEWIVRYSETLRHGGHWTYCATQQKLWTPSISPRPGRVPATWGFHCSRKRHCLLQVGCSACSDNPLRVNFPKLQACPRTLSGAGGTVASPQGTAQIPADLQGALSRSSNYQHP